MTPSHDISIPPRIVILGPTASGKSELAMQLTQAIGGEILSVDSMQIYRGMDIGTAKPTAQEQAAVVHHAIDLAEPTQTFSVNDFVTLADRVIAETPRPLVLCGGTPLYYKGLFEGLFEGPPANEALRDRLRAMSEEALHARLQEIDPAAAQRIHRNDTRRTIRAIEVFELTGKPISEHQQQWEPQSLRHQAQWFGIAWDKDELNRRINSRTKALLTAGWVEEVRALLERHGTLSHTAAEATGYAELISHVQGTMALEEAFEQIKIHTRQLARRQMKWFRRWPQVTWLSGSEGAGAMAARVLKHVKSST